MIFDVGLPERPSCMVLGLGRVANLRDVARTDVGAAAVCAAPGRYPLSRAGAWSFRRVPLGGVTVLAGIPDVSTERIGPLAVQLLEAYRLTRLIVLHEDPDLELGLLRIRSRRIQEAHKAMVSIVKALRTTAIPRVRIGVGIPGVSGPRWAPEKFSVEEGARLPPIIEKVWSVVTLLALGQEDRAMSIYNRMDRTVDGHRSGST